jgi:hypothetical protein
MHAAQAPFDVAVVGFDAVVRIASGSMATAYDGVALRSAILE